MSYSKATEARSQFVPIIDPSSDDETTAATTTVIAFIAPFAGEIKAARLFASSAFTGQASGASGNNWLLEVLNGATVMANYQTTTSSDIAVAGTSMTMSTTDANRRFAAGDTITCKATKQNSASAIARLQFGLDVLTVYDHAIATT